MAFKSLTQYQEDKNGEFFVLPNDGDSADVIFLYRSVDDVLVADAHYIMSSSYSGYAFCCGGRGKCPACDYIPPNNKYVGLKVDHKIFIPLYNIQKNKIEFWDRSVAFEQVLQKDVFSLFPNPSETVFQITRKGEARSRDTRYIIKPIARNSTMPYEKILADFNISLPEAYDRVIKEMSFSEMSVALSNNFSSDLQDYSYTPVPRGTASQQDVSATDSTPYVAPPVLNTPVSADYNIEPIAPAVNNMSNSAADDSSDSLDDVDF